eukprot:TRINITY_DN21190_c0_g1_i2.p1 TRINITY_DN21190_c0_g1~~TRINITY_DN21190_c0_g1_i2.p1  ORF type:complete len:411 (+),score=42.62 TRINITY_DN21190_c0_g1_i2:55-1233(+)
MAYRGPYGKAGPGTSRSRSDPYGKASFCVFVGNLPFDVKWQEIKDVFRECGDVEHVELMTEGGEKGGRSKGCAIVSFRSREDAERAVEELHDVDLHGRPMLVREDREGGQQGPSAARGNGKASGKGSGKASRLFVGNLAWSVTWQDLKDVFRTVGEVNHVELMTEGHVPGGRSKGCAIVEFRDRNDAKRAIAELNDTELAGRPMLVRADEVESAPMKGGFGGAGGDAEDELRCRVFVGNLDFSVTWQDLKDHMREVGEVVFAEVMTEGGVKGGRSKGCGIVQFATLGAAQRAVDRLHDSDLKGRPILVAPDEKRLLPTSHAKGGKGGDSEDELLCRVFVANLDFSVSWQDLKDHMRDVGEVTFAEVMTEGVHSERWHQRENPPRRPRRPPRL